MEKEMVIAELKELIELNKREVMSTMWDPSSQIIGARKMVSADVYNGWRTKTISFLKVFLPNDSDYIQQISKLDKNYYSNSSSCIHVLEGLIDYVDKGFIPLGETARIDTDEVLERIFQKFHRVARQLRNRHNGRPTLDVNDEYDVQDLLHALLKMYFDDVRPEEWTPSYAGKSARMDFLLKNEEIIIEVKRTRESLGDKELGDQLIIDIDRYKVHPNCKKLICFVYDPEGRIGNPNGIVKDLMQQHENYLQVYIEPMS